MSDLRVLAPGLISIVIPAFNERRRLPAAIASITDWLRAAGSRFEIIVVDDGSADGTDAVVREMQDGRPELQLIVLPANQGKGGAVKAGMLAAAGSFVVFTDADQSTSIDQLPALFAPILSGRFDVSIGSRALKHSEVEIGQAWYRRWLAYGFAVFTKALVVRGYGDTQCGFKCYTRAAVNAVFPRLTSRNALFDVEALLLAARAGFQIAEVPVVWRHDPDTRLSYGLAGSVRLVLELLRIRRTWSVRLPVNLHTSRWQGAPSAAPALSVDTSIY